MNFEAILLEKTSEGIIKVTLNRPERLNAINGRLADEVLFPDLGGFWFIPRVLGVRKAAELIYTGDFMDAAEAKEWGLLNYLTTPDKLEEVTMDLARRVAAGPPIANRLSRLLMRKCAAMDLDTALEWSATATTISENSEDHRESVDAFNEKRPAKFRGR